MSKPTCYGCKYLADTFGDYVECKKLPKLERICLLIGITGTMEVLMNAH